MFGFAIYGGSGGGLPAGSDFFDALDSAGSFGVMDQNPSDPNYNYYTNAGLYTAAYPVTTNYTVTSYTYYYDTNLVLTNIASFPVTTSVTFTSSLPTYVVTVPATRPIFMLTIIGLIISSPIT